MKLKTWRVQRHPRTNEWLLPDCPSELLATVATMMDWLVEHEDGITGYKSTSELDKFLMVQWWTRKDRLAEVIEYGDVDKFQAWFIKSATFPDIIKRARLWLMQQELVEVPDAIRRDAKRKYEMFQSSFGGKR